MSKSNRQNFTFERNSLCPAEGEIHPSRKNQTFVHETSRPLQDFLMQLQCLDKLKNTQTWLNLFASKSSAADPQTVGVYFGKAASAIAEIASLSEEVNGILDPLRGRNFVVFHDAY